MALLSIEKLLDFLPKGVSTTHKGQWTFRTENISEIMHISEQEHVDIRFFANQKLFSLTCGQTGLAALVAKRMDSLVRMITADRIDLEEFCGHCDISVHRRIEMKSNLRFAFIEEKDTYTVRIYSEEIDIKRPVTREVYEKFYALVSIVFCS